MCELLHTRAKKEAQAQIDRPAAALSPSSRLLLKAGAECEVDHTGLRLCRAKWLPWGGPMEIERKCHEKKKL
jgi:hypothetical protein